MSAYTTAKLYCSPLCENGSYTVDFTDSGARESWFNGYLKYTVNDCYYIRKDEVIKVPYNADVLDKAGINYVSYQNEAGTNIFAFVTEIEYLAQNSTALHLKTDSFVTYQFDIVRTQAFVEREHVENDAPFVHLLDEPVPTSQPVKERVEAEFYSGETVDEWLSNFLPVIFCKEAVASDPNDPDLADIPFWRGAIFLGGMVNSCFAYGVSDYNKLDKILSWLDSGISAIQKDEQGENTIHVSNNIIGVGVGVKSLTELKDSENPFGASFINIPNQDCYTSAVLTWTPDFTKINNHKVRNMKLNTRQFRYFEITDEHNATVGLNFENLHTPSYIQIDRIYCLGISSTLTWLVANYNDIDSSQTGRTSRSTKYGVTVTLPQMPFTTDSYGNWLAQNTNRINFQTLSMTTGWLTAMSNAVGGATNYNLGGMGGLVNWGLSAGEKMATMKDMKTSPDTFNGMVSGNVQMATGQLGVALYDCFPNYDTVEAIDSFFDRFGYNVSKTATMQWNSRPHYNYIKTRGANIGGEIPQKNKKEINALLDGGLTVWHVSQGGNYGEFDYNNYYG